VEFGVTFCALSSKICQVCEIVYLYTSSVNHLSFLVCYKIVMVVVYY